MGIVLALVCGLFILLGFEIRNRAILDQILELKATTERLNKEIIKLIDEVKKKQNVLKKLE